MKRTNMLHKKIKGEIGINVKYFIYMEIYGSNTCYSFFICLFGNKGISLQLKSREYILATGVSHSKVRIGHTPRLGGIKTFILLT